MSVVSPRPAATIVPLRDDSGAGAGYEVLLVQRLRRDGSAGIWVFPGGKIEDGDGPLDSEAEVLRTAKRAGIRETGEEAGVCLDPDGLGLIARWITPPVSPKRFDTWFFMAQVEPDTEVRVDGQEIRTHRWFRPQDALAARLAGEIDLAPPTLVTIHWLAEYRSVTDAMRGLVRESVPKIEPEICPVEGGACMLYPGDAGYGCGDPDRPGARNRLWSLAGTFRYERLSG